MSAKSVIVCEFYGRTPQEETKSARDYKITREHAFVSPEAWQHANEIATLYINEKLNAGALYPDLNSLAWILYEAGRMQGIKEQRKKVRRE